MKLVKFRMNQLNLISIIKIDVILANEKCDQQLHANSILDKSSEPAGKRFTLAP